MARIRTIKPEFPQSESMGQCTRDARLTFLLLFTMADDSGRLRANSRMLASLLFPYDDDAKKHIESWLLELEKVGCIQRYQVDGDSYLAINKWSMHQKIDKPTPSRIPAPLESSRELSNPLESSSRVADFPSADRIGMEGKGKEGKVSTAAPAVDNFETFWKAYPKKKAKDDALKAFNKRKPDKQLLDSMLSAIATQVRSDDWMKEGGKFIPYPATWLNDGRWQDGEVVEIASAVVIDAAAITREALQKRDEGVKPMPAHIRAQLDQVIRKITA